MSDVPPLRSPPTPTARPASPGPGGLRLYRRSTGRVLAGVCGGLADHLRLDPFAVRVTFALLTLVNGVGLALYAAFWAFVPAGPTVPDGTGAGTVTRERSQAVLLVVVVVGALLLLPGHALGLLPIAVWPLVVAAVGVALLWRQADDVERARWARIGSRRPLAVLRVAAGLVLVAGSMAWLLRSSGSVATITSALVATLVVLAGVVLVAGPWGIRLWRDLRDERRERIRSQERADLAAVVHDSVLQTLTLIQRNAASPAEVARLARAQERDLRGWLYQGRRPGAGADSLAVGVRDVAAEVEDAYGIVVDVVTVGDAPAGERVAALVQAVREALVNSAKYAGVGTVSVYAEVADGAATVFVRDRGVGFDPAEVAPDRQGIVASIGERMRRRGGSAEVRSVAGEGTEVELVMPA